MSLPNDPLGRWWLEAVPEENPTVTDEFRQCLLALLAFGPSREPSLAGTGFVIAHGDGFALAVTAKHVLPECSAINLPQSGHKARLMANISPLFRCTRRSTRYVVAGSGMVFCSASSAPGRERTPEYPRIPRVAE